MDTVYCNEHIVYAVNILLYYMHFIIMATYG